MATELPERGQEVEGRLRCPSCYGFRQVPKRSCKSCGGSGSVAFSVANTSAEPDYEEQPLFGGAE